MFSCIIKPIYKVDFHGRKAAALPVHSESKRGNRKMKKQEYKKAWAFALALIMVLTTSFGGFGFAGINGAAEEVYAVDPGLGDFTVTGGTLDSDYTYAGNVLTIKTAEPISIANVSAATATADRIVVQSGITANITLNGVNIDASPNNACAFDMTGAVVNLTLTGDNILKSGWNYAGLKVPSGAALTIGGTGSLSATGGWCGTGIGGGNGAGGTIIINGGTVAATGGTRGAGIGGGSDGAGGTIIINGGTVTATGGDNGAGIGGGLSGAGGTITISGGTVTAIAGEYGGAGIGGGWSGAGGTITINGGTATATGGDAGAGIGGGLSGTGGIIIISGAAIVTAASGSNASGIGGGWSGTSGTITINSSANIKALGQDGAPAIQSVSACSAYILMSTFTADKSSNTKTEIRTAGDAALSPAVEWTPASKYKSMAFTLPNDITTYTVYTGGAKQEYTSGVTTSSEFGIIGAGLSVFNAVTAVQAAPTATVQAITGTTQVGQTLTGHYTYSDVNADVQGVSTFKWYRADDNLGTAKAAIAGATSITYVLQAADLGKFISFEVTPIALTGTTTGFAAEGATVGPISAAPTGGGSGGGSTATTVINTNTGTVTGSQIDKAAGIAKQGDSVTIQSNQTSEVTFPASGLGSLIEKDNSLTVVTENGTLTFDGKAVSSMDTQATAADIEVIVKDVEKNALTQDQQTMVGDKSIYDLSVMSGGKLISNFGGGKITVSLPYELKADETAENLTVWYLADDGILTEISCAYDAKKKAVTFVVNHFSKYVVGYDSLAAWNNPFADIKSSDWYYDAVRYVSANGMMNGQASTEFAAEAAMTRGMFVSILGRMENIDTTAYANQTTFSDVNNSQYYAPYTAWANDKGIVCGVASGKFAPDAAITREQIAVMMTNYMKYKGQGPVGAWAIQLTYVDLEQVSSWAGEGVMFMTMKNVMNGMGKDANGASVFSPLCTCTRAQAATMLQRLAEMN